MTTKKVELEAYPKSLILRDGSKVELRLLEEGDKLALLRFFEGIPEDERYYLKENVTAPEVIREWVTNVDISHVFPVIAVADGEIVADATLHRSRSMARRHVGELRIVVSPAYRERGLGRRMIRELLDIAAGFGLRKATFEIVAARQEAAINAAMSLGFREVATLKEGVRDIWGNYQDIALLELPLKDHDLWWAY